ncbi:MAG: tetratricopeptide (TPR) repeat protein [Phycisphaerales bacterium]|jgi:tetratricopeptide (TPR) repeat protein
MNRYVLSAALGLSMVSGVGGLSGCRTGKVITQEQDLTRSRAMGNEAYYEQDFERAAEEYGKYAAVRPNEPEVRYRLGMSQLELERVSAARTNLGIAHDLAPTSDLYTEGLGRAIVAGGDQEELYAFLRNLMDSAVNASTYVTVGKVAYLGGLHDEAERAFMSAATLTGKDSAAPHRELARFYQGVGDSDSEILRWRMVLSFDVADVEANSRLRDLGIIPGPSMALEPETGVPGI